MSSTEYCSSMRGMWEFPSSMQDPTLLKLMSRVCKVSNTVIYLCNILSTDFSDYEDICMDMLTEFDALLSYFLTLDPSILTDLIVSLFMGQHHGTFPREAKRKTMH